MTSVRSHNNVAQFGEVFTPLHLVNDMLDLVAHECDRIDSRFLEPACGDGNFLAEVLRRRLAVVTKKRHRAINLWEQDALLGLACLYGIELLPDNVEACRMRLLGIFRDAYIEQFGKDCREAPVQAASIVVRSNIVQGDALAMTTVSEDGTPAKPLVLTEWSMLSGGRFKRRQFEYRELVQTAARNTGDLFSNGLQAVGTDHGQTVFIERPLRDLPLLHFRDLDQEGTV